MSGRRGRRASALVRKLWDLHVNAMTATVDSIRAYGDVIETRMPGARMFTIHRAEHAEHVLITNQDNYIKAPITRSMRRLLGRGLITTKGRARGSRQRSLAGSRCSRKRHLVLFTEHMVAAADGDRSPRGRRSIRAATRSMWPPR